MSVVDVSDVAIGKLREEAGRLGLNLDLCTVDAADYDLQPAGYDLVVLFYHFDRRLFPRIISALKPGGFFLSKLALPRSSEAASSSPGHSLRQGEIVHLLSGLHVIDHQERPVRDRGVVECVGRKPENPTPDLLRAQAQ
jgi:SAM-dependent methyltransferase